MNKILDQGILRKKISKSKSLSTKYVMQVLDERYLAQIMDLQQLIVDDLIRRDLLESFSYDFMKVHLSEKGFILGVFANNQLIAFRNVYFPDESDQVWNLGYDIPIMPICLHKVANLQMVCVHPLFRGNCLALKMNHIAINLIRKMNTYDHLCATVSPYNHWNLSILLNCGFYILSLKEKYQGKLRFIVYQHLKDSIQFIEDPTIIIPLTQFDEQKKLFENGYIGMQFKKSNLHNPNANRDDCVKAYSVVFKRPVLQNPL